MEEELDKDPRVSSPQRHGVTENPLKNREEHTNERARPDAGRAFLRVSVPLW